MFQHHRNWSARLAAISPSLLLLLALATQAAHALVTGPVTHVTIHGNRRVPEKRIRGELRNAPGRAYSHIVAGQDIERVMHLAEFSDVCITARTDAGGVAIDVVVAELPTITDVSVETSGVDAPDSRAQGIAIGRVFAPQAWQDYLRRLADALVAEDYHDAQITSLERRAPDGRTIALRASVTGGERRFIEAIDISGNSAFTVAEIEGLLHCRPRNLWLFRRGSYSLRQFNRDVAMIKAAYLSRGFLDVSVDLNLTAGSRPGLTRAVLRIMEGPQYLVNRLSWNRQAVLDSEQMNRLRARVTVRPGAPYPAHLPAALWDDVMRFLRAEEIEASVRLRSYLSADSSPLRPRIDLLISIETEPATPAAIAPWLPFAPMALPY